MKLKFLEFDYYLSEKQKKDIWQNPNTVFVLDTNVLLNLYSYQESTRQTIISNLEKITSKLWSPHQVMLEYNKKRLEIIDDSRENFNKISEHLNKFIESHSGNDKELKTFDTNHGKLYPELRTLVSEFQISNLEEVNSLVQKLKNKSEVIYQKIDELKQQTVTLVGEDKIRGKLCDFYPDDKIGEPYSEEDLNKIYEEGENRYKNKIPPGFEDSGKTEEYFHRGITYKSKFGDLVIFKQILDYCKANEKSNVIFITEDSKKDWKEKVPHENNKYYGARRELRAEAYLEAGITNFLIMNVQEFITQSENEMSLDNEIVNDLEAVHEMYFKRTFKDSILNETQEKEFVQSSNDIKERLKMNDLKIKSLETWLNEIEKNSIFDIDDIEFDKSELYDEYERLQGIYKELIEERERLNKNLRTINNLNSLRYDENVSEESNLPKVRTIRMNPMMKRKLINRLNGSDITKVKNRNSDEVVNDLIESLSDSNLNNSEKSTKARELLNIIFENSKK